MPRVGDLLEMIVYVAGFSNGIAPASPIHAEPVVPFYPCLRFELKFSEGNAAVGFRCALDFLENVQLRHRHSFLGFRTMSTENEGYSVLCRRARSF